MEELPAQKQSLIDKVIHFCLENKLVVGLLVIMFFVWGILMAPFDWDPWSPPRSPVPVDEIHGHTIELLLPNEEEEAQKPTGHGSVSNLLQHNLPQPQST